MSQKVPPLVTAGLGLLAALTLPVSPIAGLGVVALLVVALALVDGRPRTAIALIGGQALWVGGMLVAIAVAVRDRPPGTGSHAGLAFLVMPWALVLSAIATGAVFAAAHLVRRLAVRART